VSKPGLTDHQKNSLAVFVKLLRATNSVVQNTHRHLANDELTHSQFAVLEALYHLGPLCQGELSAKILKSNANITSVVDALEKKMLVGRDRPAGDRRKVIVKLTAGGRSLVEQIFPRHAEAIDRAFSVLSAQEQMELGRLLKKLGRQ